MANFALTITVPVEIPDDLNIDTVSAVAKDADFQSTVEYFCSGWLICTARSWMERAKAPSKPPLVQEATNGCTCYLQTAQTLPDASAFVTRSSMR
jgi:hypothetical protein